MRPIDADVLENMGYELHRTYPEDAKTMVYEVKKINEIPTIEAEPVRHGRWTVTPVYIKCSECGESFMLIPQNYCPNCGSLMEEE